MSQWPSARAARVYAALLRIGWSVKRRSGGSHVVLDFHESIELGPRMLARIAKRTGLAPGDL